MRKHSYIIPFSLVSITKYDDKLKGICHGTIDFLARQKIVASKAPKLVDGIAKIWWVKLIVRSRSRVDRFFLQNKQNFA